MTKLMSPVTTLYVLKGSTGSYDFHTSCLVMAYETREAALRHKTPAEDAYKQEKLRVYRENYGSDSAYTQRCHVVYADGPTPYDPYLRDFDGFVHYSIVELPARLGALPPQDIANARFVLPVPEQSAHVGEVANTQMAEKLRAVLATW